MLPALSVYDVDRTRQHVQTHLSTAIGFDSSRHEDCTELTSHDSNYGQASGTDQTVNLNGEVNPTGCTDRCVYTARGQVCSNVVGVAGKKQPTTRKSQHPQAGCVAPQTALQSVG